MVDEFFFFTFKSKIAQKRTQPPNRGTNGRYATIAASTHHFVLIEQLDDDGGRVFLDLLGGAVDQDVVEQQQLVPRWAEGLVDHLGALAKLTADHAREGIGEAGRVAADQRSRLVHVGPQLKFLAIKICKRRAVTHLRAVRLLGEIIRVKKSTYALLDVVDHGRRQSARSVHVPQLVADLVALGQTLDKVLLVLQHA